MSSPNDNTSPHARAYYDNHVARRRQLSSGPLGGLTYGGTNPMKQIISFLLFLFVATAIQSCKKNDNPIVNNTQPATPFIPLAVGNKWTYTFKGFDTTGNLQWTNSYYTQITRDTLIQNQQWFLYPQNTSLYPIDYLIARNQTDGFYSWDTLLNTSILLYKYSAARNYSYNIPIKVADTTMYLMATVVSVDTLITVPAGQFTCYNYFIPPTFFTRRGNVYAYGGENTYISEKGIAKKQYVQLTPSGHFYVYQSMELQSIVLK
jgi:hypothetical protein